MGIARSLTRRLRGTTAWPLREDINWRSASFAVIDVETTGLDLARDEIVSIGVARVSDGRLQADHFYEVVRPPCPISEGAMKVHGLTAAELCSAPSLEEVIPLLRNWVSGRAIVAHAAWVERAFLNRALRGSGERVPDRLVDTAGLARNLGLVECSEREPALEGLARTLKLPVHTPHHALGDAVTTAEVLLVLASRLEQRLGSVTVGDLLTRSATR